MQGIDKAAFWDKKILVWEKKRYGDVGALYDRVFNGSVRARRKIALELLGPRVEGKTVLEVGCGSGHLAKDILALGARKYIGADFSAVAIENAKKLFAGDDRIEFVVAGAGDLPAEDFDVCFSAGLLDWLEDEEIRRLVTTTGERDFVHSFSEARKGDVLRRIHSRYVHLKYGHKERSYVPRYMTESEIKGIFGSSSEIHRDVSMRFGAFVTRGRSA